MVMGRGKRQQVLHDCSNSNICIITSSILTDKRVGGKNSLIFLFSRVTDGRRRPTYNVTIRRSLFTKPLYTYIYQTLFFFFFINIDLSYNLLFSPTNKGFVDLISSEILEIIKIPENNHHAVGFFLLFYIYL